MILLPSRERSEFSCKIVCMVSSTSRFMGPSPLALLRPLLQTVAKTQTRRHMSIPTLDLLGSLRQFLIFFLIQTMSKIHIHPFQYLMIGLALVMFYTLLVSISEHSNFLKAYLIAGISVVLLITLYSKSILRNFKFSALIGLSLTALYSFIYVIIQLENYALLVGSIGLFVILATVMFVSRKIDWSNG